MLAKAPWQPTTLCLTPHDSKMWERACSRKRPDSQPLSNCHPAIQKCGSGLAREDGLAANHSLPDTPRFKNVGAGLPAKTAWQPTTLCLTPHDSKMWERACSRKRPDSQPLSNCHPASQLWERACPRRRPDSRPGCWIRPGTYPLFRLRLILVPLLQRVTLEKSPKVTKGLLPQHSAPRSRSVCP